MEYTCVEAILESLLLLSHDEALDFAFLNFMCTSKLHSTYTSCKYVSTYQRTREQHYRLRNCSSKRIFWIKIQPKRNLEKLLDPIQVVDS